MGEPYGAVSRRLVEDTRYAGLSPKARLVLVTLHVCPRGNMAGLMRYTFEELSCSTASMSRRGRTSGG